MIFAGDQISCDLTALTGGSGNILCSLQVHYTDATSEKTDDVSNNAKTVLLQPTSVGKEIDFLAVRFARSNGPAGDPSNVTRGIICVRMILNDSQIICPPNYPAP